MEKRNMLDIVIVDNILNGFDFESIVRQDLEGGFIIEEIGGELKHLLSLGVISEEEYYLILDKFIDRYNEVLESIGDGLEDIDDGAVIEEGGEGLGVVKNRGDVSE